MNSTSIPDARGTRSIFATGSARAKRARDVHDGLLMGPHANASWQDMEPKQLVTNNGTSSDGETSKQVTQLNTPAPGQHRRYYLQLELDAKLARRRNEMSSNTLHGNKYT